MHTRLGLAVAALLVAPLAACGNGGSSSASASAGSSTMTPITPVSSPTPTATTHATGDGSKTEQLELDPLNGDGSVKSEFHIANTVAESKPVTCSQASPAAKSAGVYHCTPPSEACVAALNSPEYAGQVLCLMSATEPTLMLHKAEKLETVAPLQSPSPLEMETADGSRWVMSAADQATTKARPDGLVDVYDCAAGPCEKDQQSQDSRMAVLGQPGAGGAAIDGSTPVWTVKVGPTGSGVAAAPVAQKVTKAWFVKNSSAH